MKHRTTLVIKLYFLIITNICSAQTEPLFIHTIYNDFIITEPVLIDLFNNPIMERIKKVRQYGVLDYIIKQKKEYTRYEHCVGVWALLKMYDASLETQIAGLLHDASHTVFSHVGDTLFNHQSALSSYQDDIHEWYLKQYNIDALLARHNISLDTILHKSGTHTMLEQDLPHLCADRLEYNLQAGLLTNMLTINDISAILNDLRYENNTWFFTSTESAKKLALVSLFNTEHVWGSPADKFIYDWTARALDRALAIGLLTTNDIHFSTDPVIWDKLWISNDEYINECLNKIIHYKSILGETEPQQKDLVIKRKFRGIDPLIQINYQLQRLTEVDSEYLQKYEHVKNNVLK